MLHTVTLVQRIYYHGMLTVVSQPFRKGHMPVTLLLHDYFCWKLGDAGGWGHCLSGCSMLGMKEKNRGGERLV